MTSQIHRKLSEEMSSFHINRLGPNSENALKTHKKHKNKKAKKEKKDKNKTKCAPNTLLPDDCYETVYTQIQENTQRKKSKKKRKLKEDVLQPKSKKQKQGDMQQIQPIILISSDPESQQLTKNKSEKMLKGTKKAKKKVNFSLPLVQIQAAKTNDEYGKKQVYSESSLESTTAEEINSQDLFITQKSFLDPCVEISSSSSGNEPTTVKEQEKLSCRSTAEASTQTENFFTFPVSSSSLRFQQQQKIKSTFSEEPMDLSLPNRTRQTHTKHRTLDSTLKLKTSDMSSEEDEMVSKTRGDLLQLKVIQTRLNEAFFFKVKGEDSPKPSFPLMKLKETVEKRAKK